MASPHMRERGSLILDVLIGMAIFALVAFIAATAVGQYRMRGYVQAAMSDATQAARAYTAALLDHDGSDDESDLPTGLLDDEQLKALEVNRTHHGGEASQIHVLVPDAGPDAFRVCVTYRGAFAIYDVAAGGLIDAGEASRKGFEGCATDGETWPGGDAPSAGGPGAPAPGGDQPGQPGETPGGTQPGDGLPGDGGSGPDEPTFFDDFPEDPGDYGNAVSGVPCPTLAGVDSYHDYAGQYPYDVFFETPVEELRAASGRSDLKIQFRLIDTRSKTVTAWRESSRYTYVEGTPGETFYIEVSAVSGGERAPQCDTVGKFTLRNSPNWTPGSVDRLSGAPAPQWEPRVSPVPCPVITEARWSRSASGTNISVKGEAPAGYAWEYRAVDPSDPSASGGGLTSSLGPPNADGFRSKLDPWRTNGESRIYQVFLTGGGHTGGGRRGLRSEYCTQVVRVDRPAVAPPSGEMRPAQVLDVYPFY